MTVSRFTRRHLHAWVWSQVAFLCTWALCIWALLAMPPGGVLRTVLVLSPIPAGFVIYGVGCWLYFASDEYIRVRILMAATVSALVMSAFALVYSYLALLGFSQPPLYWVHNIGWAVFVVQMLRVIYSTK